MNITSTSTNVASVVTQPEHADRPAWPPTRSVTSARGSDGADFASVLAQFASDAAQTVRAGEVTAAAGVTGNAPVQKVAEAVMAAEQTLQTAIVLRDKVVAAYLELSRMAI